MQHNDKTLRNHDPKQFVVSQNNNKGSELAFKMLCYAFKYNGVIDDAIRLWLFPFSLINSAFSWLDSRKPSRNMGAFQDVDSEVPTPWIT
ncbi:hypothetical protein EPI10_031510 [Gossypium australe]|uniref:Uncharacterized protein n=1 Tax=Gossypium australe TaxID=47621 RepID=A0A5B6X2B0_9ROSI|nr:hypothetical protein EPI10_031510 [Gossypium australe]